MAYDIKTRDPSKLYHVDYLKFVQNVVVWSGTQVGEPDYPAHLAPLLGPAVDVFDAALALWDDLNEDQKGKNEVFSNTSTAIAKHLQLLKDVIPTTIDNPPVLAEFGLDRKVPADRDELFIMAQTCVGQWNEIIVPAVPPEYLPLEADFTTLLALFADFEAAKVAYYAQLNAAQQAQNAMLDARAACHELERKIFNWYRARHTDAKAEWWTATWWGCTGASSGGDEPEPPDSWEDAVTGFKVSESPFGLAFIQGVLHPDADGVAIYMAEGPLGVDSQPLMPPEPHEAEVPSLPYSMDVSKNVRVWIWICHVKDGVHGAIAGALWVEIME